jgi:hypothetical protein
MLPACYVMLSERGGVQDNVNKDLLLFFRLTQALVMFFTCYFSTLLFFMNIKCS